MLGGEIQAVNRAATLGTGDGGMQGASYREAARLIAAARSGSCLRELPPALQPRTADDAFKIQVALAEVLQEQVGGWKISNVEGFGIAVGLIIRSRCFESGTTENQSGLPMLGVEAEIAFHFDRSFPPREEPYGREEVSEGMTAFAAIEIVGSRFCSYDDTAAIVRAADFMSNTAFVAGPLQPKWRSLDLSTIEVTLSIDGAEAVRRRGGHPSDPLDQAVALVNSLGPFGGVPKGKFVTTGTFTGLTRVAKARAIKAEFAGFEPAEIVLD